MILFSLQRVAFLAVVTYPSVTSLKFHHLVWKTYLLSSPSLSSVYNVLKFFCINEWTDTPHFVQHHYLESSRIYSPWVFNVYFYFFCPRVPRSFSSSLFQGFLMILSKDCVSATGSLIFLSKQCFVLKFYFWVFPFPYIFMYLRIQVGDWQMQWIQERSLLWAEGPRSIRCFLYVYRCPMKVWTVSQVK